MTNPITTALLQPTVWPNAEPTVLCRVVAPKLLRRVRKRFVTTAQSLQRLRHSVAQLRGRAYLLYETVSPVAAVQRTYRLSEPLDSADYVVVSAVVALYSGPETYVFESDPDGHVIDWGELDGSFRGELDHEQALRNAGYEVV